MLKLGKVTLNKFKGHKWVFNKHNKIIYSLNVIKLMKFIEILKQ